MFRKRGYHATGLNDILEVAQAPKGSMYHHFLAGKEEIGVYVIQNITAGLLGLFAQSRARSTQAMVQQVGQLLVIVAEKTQMAVALLEGGSLLAQARQDASLFRAAVKQAALICRVNKA